jgi:Nif-specific regulatory protein
MSNAREEGWAEHELDLLRSELETLYLVSKVLSHSLNFKQTLDGVLNALHEGMALERGMVSLMDVASGELQVSLVYGVSDTVTEEISYLPGEGVVGNILKSGNSIVVDCIMNEPRFLSRMGIYNPQGSFVGVPIRIGKKVVGVLAAQPAPGMKKLLKEYQRFLEMVANLIGQSVRLSHEVAQEKMEIVAERDVLRRSVRSQFGFDNIIGHTQSMKKIFEQVRLVAKWNTTVLIRGETGTGKELIANAIHYNSPRARGSFVKLNCAALPETLLESELFGHEKGSFTGAVAQRKGRFEQAEGGTVFLDEIGEISASFQAKLLRVLQEGELERVGGSKTIKVDVRIVAATHRDLEAEVEKGRFREDLYYRLNVMPLYLPPVRERMEDLPEIARFLVDKIGTKQGRPLTLADTALRVLMHHDWPGNVRELENCLERASVMTEGNQIDRDAILLTGIDEKISTSHGAVQSLNLDDPNLDERERVIAALEQAGWVQAKAARLLDMSPRQIAYRIQTLNIKVRQI